MQLQSLSVFLSKLAGGALAFVVGLMVGGALASFSGLPAPDLPPGMNANAALFTFFVTSPVLVLALYFVGRELAGGWLARAAVLALLTWVAYTLNNVIEALFFSSHVTSPWFTLVNFTPAVLLCAGVTAWLFPGRHREMTFRQAWRTHFRQRSGRAWAWRLPVAAFSFVPIYYGFGLLVVPFVGDVYQQGAFGLAVPSLGTLLVVLLVRSVLFCIACLPVVATWQGTRRDLWLSLGVALFVMVGLLYMLAGNWLPLSIRAVHSLEILADSLVHAAALSWLLGSGKAPAPTRLAQSPRKLASA